MHGKNQKLLTIICIVSSMFLVKAYAAGIVNTGTSGNIESIFDFQSTGSLRTTVLNLLRDIIYFVRLALN